jgi:hypothetical protein
MDFDPGRRTTWRIGAWAVGANQLAPGAVSAVSGTPPILPPRPGGVDGALGKLAPVFA